jgi:hypothetical protein
MLTTEGIYYVTYAVNKEKTLKHFQRELKIPFRIAAVRADNPE